MELNSAQNTFLGELRTMLSLYKDNADPRLKTPATNLEWNVKKLTGEYGDGSLDGPTFARRSKADLELIATALPAGTAGQPFAVRGASQVESIFGGAAPAPAPVVAAGVPAAPEAPAPAPIEMPTVDPNAAPPVDIKSVLSEKAEHAGEKLAWKTSVVDLLKLLGKDASQSARHRYAVDLGFPESEISKMPSSEFNDWLHGQLLATLAQNGGELPANIA